MLGASHLESESDNTDQSQNIGDVILIKKDDIPNYIRQRGAVFFARSDLQIYDLSSSEGVSSPFEAYSVVTFDHDDVFLKGHFPGNPVVPATFVLEAVGQFASAVLSYFNLKNFPTQSGKARGIYFASCGKVKMRRFVKPGEELKVKMSGAVKRKGKNIFVNASIYYDNEMAADVDSLHLIVLDD